MEKTFVESVASYLKGKNVEVYAGTSSKSRAYSDFEVQQKEVIRGILKDAIGELLIIEVDNGINTNVVYVNGWSVVAILEPQNGISIIDVYVDEHTKQKK